VLSQLEKSAARQLFGTSDGDNDNAAIYRWDGPGQPLKEIARKNTPAPNGVGKLIPVGTSSSLFFEPVMNDFGEVAFVAELKDSGNAFDEGIYLGDGNSLVPIVRSGDDIPGGEPGIDTFSDGFRFTAPSINNVGQVAFAGDSGGDSSLDGVFRGTGSSLATVARSGTNVEGSVLTSIGGVVAINEPGDVVFRAGVDSLGSIDGSTDGLFVGREGGVSRIAQERMPAPGGGFFSNFSHSDEFALNDPRQVAFQASVSDSEDGTGLQTKGLFTYDDAVGLAKIARVGDPFEGSEIVDLNFAGPSLHFSHGCQ